MCSVIPLPVIPLIQNFLMYNNASTVLSNPLIKGCVLTDKNTVVTNSLVMF